MTLLDPVTLILGGARSGKSAYAEERIATHCAARSCGATYIATAETGAGDDEMADRIAAHRARRGALWTTVEAPVALGPALVRASSGKGALLVDSLTVWLGNLMHHGHDLEEETLRLLDALDGLDVPVVFVSDEVGLGIVPENALARRFRDALGLLNQTLAANADAVWFVAAGLPLALKTPASTLR
ncbi:MAG: bifunctional adenosylcobinamide kinase/adenosylcobinamide-phosphate guanylyltransferase [Rhodospirillales bacterium]